MLTKRQCKNIMYGSEMELIDGGYIRGDSTATGKLINNLVGA